MEPSFLPPTPERASYRASIKQFLETSPAEVLGRLVSASDGDVTEAQRYAWQTQIHLLRRALETGFERTEGLLCFEFVIPRIGKRVDNILLVGRRILVIEFKVGAKAYLAADRRQVTDYALDLKNFHEGSHEAEIVPILVATDAAPVAEAPAAAYDRVHAVRHANGTGLATLLRDSIGDALGDVALHHRWLASAYKPTPTIIEASKALYQRHGVQAITHSEAGKDNLGITTTAIRSAVDEAKRAGEKVIVFVSGVPGAGKTLAGLNLACERRRAGDGEAGRAEHEHAVFLSGNGPLVKVLQEALARDEVMRARARNERAVKSESHRKVVAFIQNIHHFRDEFLESGKAPVDRLVVFDEAQRAWNRDQTTRFMKHKRGRDGFDESELELLIRAMDAHEGWAGIVCLIGGGQEINTGEAGLEAWLQALASRFPHWRVHIATQLDTTGDLGGFDLSRLGTRLTKNPALHLSVSLRSFRAEGLSKAIGALIDGNADQAAVEFGNIRSDYPIFLTRSLERAKAWVKRRARGSERIGLLASSGAKRLKPLGIHMDVQVDPCVWFLNDPEDVRSSCYLEDAASEFDVQGLELDWTVVVWDGDLLRGSEGWLCRAFKGTRWENIGPELHGAGNGVGKERRDASERDEARTVRARYRLNAYRVLPTRARQGMVIVVPEGDGRDPTRAQAYYDPTWRFLLSAGMRELVEEGQERAERDAMSAS